MSDRVASRRSFLAALSAAAAAAPWAHAASAQDEAPAPPVPPGIDADTIAQAEKLVKLEYTDAEREQILHSIGDAFGIWEELRKAKLENAEGPAEVFDPRLPGQSFARVRAPGKFALAAPGKLPDADVDIAFASIASLSHWVKSGQLACERLARIYFDRLKRLDAKLLAVITLCEERALAQAKALDAELKAGKWRGPLHGIPWGAKDLFDTAGIATTWGAEPWKDRVPETDAAVVKRLDAAGAILVAKLSLGALAYGDIWFGGRTNNPWKLDQGSSGSSAGSAATTAAGCVAFAIGTETYGSIMSPSSRCGTTGFRPTFGAVSRAGAMALSWSLDKVGPICRSVEDCAIVLDAIAGADAADPATIDVPLAIDVSGDAAKSIDGLTIGWLASEFEGPRVSAGDHAVVDALKASGAKLVPVTVPKGPYGDVIFFLISVEGAAAFDEMTRFDEDDQLKWQAREAWPNTFRTARLFPAVEFMQARRLRRRFMQVARDVFANVDVLIAPQNHGDLHALTNMTGQPALTLRTGFRKDGTPTAITAWAGLFDDAKLLRLGRALEAALGVSDKRPPID